MYARRACSSLYNFQNLVRGLATGAKTFESLGVNDFVLRGVQRTFPHVKSPTPVQAQFIPAVISGKDVLLKDRTGTGKSFGILLALCSKVRALRHVQPRYWKDRAMKTTIQKEAISSLLIVPHNDLAHQFIHWLKVMKLSRDFDELAQTLLKDPSESYTDQLSRIEKIPPHILVATPKALDDCWKNGRPMFSGLETLNTIVLDEADSMLRIPSNDTPSALQKRWRKHPPMLLEILEDIFRIRPKVNGGKMTERKANLQLVVISATLKPAIRKFLHLDTDWLSSDSGGTVTIEGTAAMDMRKDPVRHYGLFVDVTGALRNIVDPEEGDDTPSVVDDPSRQELDHEKESVPAESSMETDNLIWGGKRLPSQLLDAVASTFALDVPEYALLIIPSSVPVAHTITDLAQLGIKAINLDDYVLKPKEAITKVHNMPDEDSDSESDEKGEPIMLVAVQSAIRGIDLPIISHVFIAGLPESEVDYVHLAGRVGRMGAPTGGEGKVKKVITFLPEPDLDMRTGQQKIVKKDDDSKKQLEIMWRKIGIRPSVYARAI